MKTRILGILLMLGVILAGCANEEADTKVDENSNVDESVDVKQLVNDFTTRKAVAESASITSSELIITDENQEVTKHALPEDEFFVSIAPFKTTTHPCDIHSLTGCQGELVEEDFDILVEDPEGNVVLDETKTTETNGFIDLWLPRDDTFTVTITQGDKQSVSEIPTFEGDNTCITTMQLQ